MRRVPPQTHPGLSRVPVERGGEVGEDWVVVEEPLEIRVDGEPLAVTMRTPGHDRELAAGFLYTEGVIDGPAQLVGIEPCRNLKNPDARNLIFVTLAEEARADRRKVEKARRELVAASGCGLCGKARLADLYQSLPKIEPLECALDFLLSLPERMRPHQELFEHTGAIHAAALFDPAGEMLALYEDVGRHNAVDKLIGHFLFEDRLPLAGKILVVSGRAGFEIVQKAAVAAVPVLVSVGAASSLAVELARASGMTLVSFVSRGRGHRHG